MTSYATEILVRELIRQRLRDAEQDRLARTARAYRGSSRAWREWLSLPGSDSKRKREDRWMEGVVPETRESGLHGA